MPVRDAWMCQYTGKLCYNPRATGRASGLLRHCVFHRALANRNQERYKIRKRMAQRFGKSTSPALETTAKSAMDTGLDQPDAGKERHDNVSVHELLPIPFDPAVLGESDLGLDLSSEIDSMLFSWAAETLEEIDGGADATVAAV